MDDMMIFAERLTAEMELQKLTYRQLAEKTGITVTTLFRYAKGQRIPKATEIVKASKALGVTCDYLIGLSDDPHKTSTESVYYPVSVNTDFVSKQAATTIPVMPKEQHGRTFQEIVVEYLSYNTYPEYKGKPYFSIKYTENGQWFIGYGTYKPEVLSEYLKEYFMPSALSSAQPTLYGYNIEHLEMIARVLQKEDLSPERVVEALTDIGRIVEIIKDEIEETLRRAVDQCVT